MSANIVSKEQLGFQWPTFDPFLFCVHHLDTYPKSNGQFGPDDSLIGRHLGQDFAGKDGWRMYHGQQVPGFPGHPHRGFETVTVVEKGYVDHADSLGAAGRYANGDVQWMTAGAGILHSEMFPLLDRNPDNTLELFQIWLNLPAKAKMVDPHFKMLWQENIPVHEVTGQATVKVIAGSFDSVEPQAPPPNSWAAAPANQVAIWIIHIKPQSSLQLPATEAAVRRNLYYYQGQGLSVDSQLIEPYHRVEVLADEEIILKTGDQPASLLLLQGKPIGEPVVQYGPFVMNTKAEIEKAFADYQSTQFGGWPWPAADPVHGQEQRFARHASGQSEQP